MKTYFLLLCCILLAASVHAEQICKPYSIPASTPDSQLIDNGDGTITDSKTRLVWKKCLEGITGNLCETGTLDLFSWQEALQQPNVVNNNGGFSGYIDWRLPSINELGSIVEEQCYDPAINLNHFSNMPSASLWSGSPYAIFNNAWCIYFSNGDSVSCSRDSYHAVRLVRGGN